MFEITRSTLTLFGFSLHWYGILIALGVFCAVALACKREKRLGFPKDTTLDIALICVPAAILCARLYYVLFSWDYYAAHPAEILDVRKGGLAIYGGVIGGVLVGYIYCRIKKLSFQKGLDLVAPSLALGQAVGRWGNFLNQEAYGRAVLNSKFQFFPIAVYIDNSGWHCATFFYESLWCALIVAFILIAERRRFFRRDGDIFGWYLLLYGLERTFVEGLRMDSLYWGGVRVSQLLSLALMLAAALWLVARDRKCPPFLRLLPALTVILLGTALALKWNVFMAILALLLLGETAIIYNRIYNRKKSFSGTQEENMR